MAAWENLRSAIISKLEGISQLNQVLEFPSEEFTKFPVALLETVRNEAIFESTTQNQRVYVFNVYILQDIESQGMKQARRIIQDAVDAVMDAFDNDQELTSASMPDSEPVMIAVPALSSIFTNIDGKYVVGQIELKVLTSFSIS